MIRKIALATAAPFVVAACATAPRQQPPPPDYVEIATDPAPAHARLYADCFEQAIAGRAYRRAANGGDELLLFTCVGAPAAAMFTALGPWSAGIGSEWSADGRVWRSTAAVQRDLFGVDYCSAEPSGADPRCVITFNAGDFLDQ